jgi:RimJ/RimL family protein N-acetyltransferase
MTELKGNKCRLRSWHSGDADQLISQANNRLIANNLRDSFPYPYSMQDARAWIEFATKAPKTLFAIAIDEKLAGGIGFHLLSDVYRKNAELGYWLGEKFWNQGIATEAVELIIPYIFKNFDINRIFAECFSDNPGSGRVLEKAGFRFESRHIRSIYKNNEYKDSHIYALLKEEWVKKSTALNG